MFERMRRPLAVVVLALVAVDRLPAQVDYRNLDFERPLRVSDAVPVERFGFEFSARSSYTRFAGADVGAVAAHLDHGLGRNVMVGAGVQYGLTGTDPNPAAVSLEALWSPQRETPGLPGLGFHAEVHTSRGVGTAVAIAGLATRSFGRSRFHVNVAALPIRADAADGRWWAGLAFDRSLLRSSTLLGLEVNAVDQGGSLGWILGGGFRRQVAPTIVVYVGASQSLNGPSATELSAGLSQAFGIRGLMRRAPR